MYFIAFLGHFEVKILKNMWNFVKNSQSTNILPQIWLKVQILLPPPSPGIFEEYISLQNTIQLSPLLLEALTSEIKKSKRHYSYVFKS